MKRLSLVLALSLVLLSGCGAVPQGREVGSTAILGVLGFQPDPQGLTLYAAAEERGGQPPAVYQGKGTTPAAALEDLTGQGEKVVSSSHVEHLLLSQAGADRLEEILSYAFQDPRQSTESQLWLVRTDDLSQVFDGEQDPARRLSVLKAAGKEGRGFRPLTLREAAAALAAGEALLIPALDQGEAGLSFGGFGLFHQGEVIAWLTGEAALGASLLQGHTIRWTTSVGEGALSLRSTGIRVQPVWEAGALTGLSLECTLEGVPSGGWESRAAHQRAVVNQTAQAMDAALRIMQRAGVDGAGLKTRAGLTAPLNWQELSDRWPRDFPALRPTYSIPITTGERY